MPAYSKTTWSNGNLPAIDDTNLNKIEQGIFDSLRQDGSTTMSGQLVTTAGSAGTPAIAPTGNSNTGIFFPAADTIAFGEGGLEAMRINSSGQVGIGTTNPADKLHVVGNIYLGTANQTIYTGGSGNLTLQTNTGTILFNRNNGADESMRITSAGNVGIGVNPNVELHVKGTGEIFRLETTAATGDNFIRFYAPSSVTQGYVGYTSAANNAMNINQVLNNDLLFHTNNTERMRLTSAGNVGIGTASPTVATNVTTVCANNTAGSQFELFVNGTRTGVFTASATTVSLRNLTANPLLFFSDSTERLHLESGGRLRPSANNAYELGSSSFRWSTIYAQNALNTSDARLKKEVTTSSLGLDFINQLNPVQYKWIEGGNSVDRVQTGTETVEIAPAIPAQPEQPEVLDEEGNVIQEYVPATEEVPAVTEERPTYEEVVTPREGVRTHFGLIAQEVKAALPDGLDFAGWCLADKDDPESTQSLGYTNFIAPMIKAIQELSAEVQALKAQLNK